MRCSHIHFPARLKLPTFATPYLGIFNARRGELFILWALHGIHINTAFHIVHHLDEQAKQSKAVIASGGIVTALLHGLGLQNLCTLTSKQHDGERINLATCVNIELFEVIGGQVWLTHHGAHLFSLPNLEKITIIEKANWRYDNVIDAQGDDVGDGGQHPPEGGPSEAQQQLQGATQQEPQDAVGHSGSTEPSLRHFLTDEFACLHLLFDQMSAQHSQDYTKLIYQHNEWDRQ